MTDLEKLIALFVSFGLKEYKDFEGDYEVLKTSKMKWEADDPFKHAGVGEKQVGPDEILKWDTMVKLLTGVGYGEFFCSYYFLNGKFQDYGCWE